MDTFSPNPFSEWKSWPSFDCSTFCLSLLSHILYKLSHHSRDLLFNRIFPVWLPPGRTQTVWQTQLDRHTSSNREAVLHTFWKATVLEETKGEGSVTKQEGASSTWLLFEKNFSPLQKQLCNKHGFHGIRSFLAIVIKMLTYMFHCSVSGCVIPGHRCIWKIWYKHTPATGPGSLAPGVLAAGWWTRPYGDKSFPWGDSVFTPDSEPPDLRPSQDLQTAGWGAPGNKNQGKETETESLPKGASVFKQVEYEVKWAKGPLSPKFQKQGKN